MAQAPAGPRDDDDRGAGEPLAVVTSGLLPPDDRSAGAPGGAADAAATRGTRVSSLHAARPLPPEVPAVVRPGAGDPAPRLDLDEVQVLTTVLDVTATVVLRDGDDRHTGTAVAAATAGGHLRSLATATARALESAMDGQCRLEVEGVEVARVAGQETAVVVLSIVSVRGTERLTGACAAGEDPHRAVVTAVLAASNRRVALDPPGR